MGLLRRLSGSDSPSATKTSSVTPPSKRKSSSTAAPDVKVPDDAVQDADITAKVLIDRDAATATITLYLMKRDGRLGISIDDGNCVHEVDEGSAGQDAGFQKNDWIISVSGVTVVSYNETLPLLRTITNHTPVPVVVGYVPADHPSRSPDLIATGAGAGAAIAAVFGAVASDDEDDDQFKEAKEFAKILKMEKELAAAQVQAVMRGNTARSDSEQENDDRFKEAREFAKVVKMEEKLEKEMAAAQVQAVTRGRKARLGKTEMEKATTQLQAVMRGRTVRRKQTETKSELSELLKAETVAIFLAMDLDEDGAVTKAEASRFFTSFGKLNAIAMFNEVDVVHEVDSDVAVITLAEWVGFWQNVKANGYSEEEMREELANMASGQSWVDFNDGRSTGESSHGTPPTPRRTTGLQPTSFQPKRSPLVPTVSPSLAGGRKPLHHLSAKKPMAIQRQKSASEWMAEQAYKFVSLADISKKWTPADDVSCGGDLVSKQTAKAAERNAKSAGPREADLDQYVGVWRAAGLEGRDELLKAMALPWILRQIAKALPQPDNIFFRDDEGALRSHSTSLGRTTEETYKEGGSSVKTFKGVTTTVTYHWEGAVLTYVAVKEGAPEEEASSRRWVEPDRCTMVAESLFRKDKSQPWAKLRRTWTLDHKLQREREAAK